MSNNLSLKILKEAETLDEATIEEYCQYMYEDAGGEIDSIPSFERVNDYLFYVEKRDYNKLYKMVKKAIENVADHFYNGKIELSDRATMGMLSGNVDDVDPDESLFTYEKLRDEAFAKFEDETGVEIWQDGRSGRHIVVDDNFSNAYNYYNLCNIQEKWEDWVLEEFEKAYPFPEEETKVNEGLKEAEEREIINPEDKLYSDDTLWDVGLYPGAGAELSIFRVYAFSEEDALNKVVAHCEKEKLFGLIHSLSDVEDNVKNDFTADYESNQDKYDEDWMDFAINEFNYIYVDATMDGATQPYFVDGTNLMIKQVEGIKEGVIVNIKDKDNWNKYIKSVDSFDGKTLKFTPNKSAKNEGSSYADGLKNTLEEEIGREVINWDFASNDAFAVFKEGTSIPRNAKKIKLGDDEYYKDGDSWGKTSEKDLVIPRRYPISQIKMQSKLDGKDIEVTEVDKDYKPTRTREVKVLQGNYGYGWDDLLTYDTKDKEEMEALRRDIKDYRENEPNAQHRVITRREKIEEASKVIKESNNWKDGKFIEPKWFKDKKLYNRFKKFVDSQLKDGRGIDDPDYVNTLTPEEYENLLVNTWMKDQEEIDMFEEHLREEGILDEAVDENKLIDNDMTIKELDDTAKWLYDNNRDEWDKFTDNELIELAKLCQISKENPWGRAYDDEVFDEMDRRGLKLEIKEEVTESKPESATKTNTKAKVRDYLNYELEDDDTEEGGVSFNGETVADFIADVDMSEDDDLDKLNKALVTCGIRPIKESYSDEIKYVSPDEMEDTVDAWCNSKGSIGYNRYLTKDNGVWVAVDNRTGDCWTEEFKDKKTALAWLNDEIEADGSVNEAVEEDQAYYYEIPITYGPNDTSNINVVVTNGKSSGYSYEEIKKALSGIAIYNNDLSGEEYMQDIKLNDGKWLEFKGKDGDDRYSVYKFTVIHSYKESSNGTKPMKESRKEQKAWSDDGWSLNIREMVARFLEDENSSSNITDEEVDKVAGCVLDDDEFMSKFEDIIREAALKAAGKDNK